ncbi:MAG: glycogen/starch synthase [Patescibacteria group bacterium]
MSFFKAKSRLKVLFVAPEASPFIKAGGLGEVMFALPRALVRLGYDARLMVPRYAGIDLEKFTLEMEMEGLRVPTGAEGTDEQEPKELICNVRRFVPREGNGGKRAPVHTYFLENLEYYEKRSNIYGYSDDAIRWALLCRGTLEFLKQSSWIPDVIVASDWQTGFLPNYLRTVYRDVDKFENIATVFMIHNLYYQGVFDHRFVTEMDYDDGHSPLPSFFDHRLLKTNGMRRGIVHSDLVSVVSPTYAREIMTSEYGELLDSLLRERRSRVYGVLNGIDYEDWDPEHDRYLAENYDRSHLEARSGNKRELQSRFGLEEHDHAFLIAIASRFSEQKGFDLLFSSVDVILRELHVQFAILGTGDGKYMGFFQDLERRYPGRVGTHLSFDTVMPHMIHGGADAILMPSKFEPAGLLQLEAMRYGAIPIARSTGGLADTVEDFDPMKGIGTGFTFRDFDAQAMMVAVVRGYENFRNTSVWRNIQRRAMGRDFSWDTSAREYGHLFSLTTGFRKRTVERE